MIAICFKRSKRMNDSYKVKLPTFEGPLDLLLHLIKELEIDIYDIPVAEITDQYMHYIQTMQSIELNIASEYLVMAATLIEMKSAMLLPKKEVEYDDEYEEDPREQLMQRLIEYRQYKEVATELQHKELDENEVFTRTPMQLEEDIVQSTVIQGDISIFDMLQAYQKMLKRKKLQAPLETTINRVDISVDQRMHEIMHQLQQAKQPILFDDLFKEHNKGYIVTTFLAILQLMKNNDVNCEQKRHFGPIYIANKRGDAT